MTSLEEEYKTTINVLKDQIRSLSEQERSQRKRIELLQAQLDNVGLEQESEITELKNNIQTLTQTQQHL